MRRVERLHLAVLGLWLGAMLGVGGVAAWAFPAMKALQPALPGYRIDLTLHPPIAAGHIMNPAFLVLMVAGPLLALTALAAWPVLNRVRRLGTVAALALALVTLLAIGFPMRGHLHRFWEAARLGEVEAADAAKSRFDALHPWSSRALGTQAALVAVLIVLAMIPRRTDPPVTRTDDATP